MKITEFNKVLLEDNKLYKTNEEYINKIGLDAFLRQYGAFVEIIPKFHHPKEGGKLMNVSIEIEYWTTIKDENHWNMGFYEEIEKYSNMVAATNIAIKKAFGFIERRLRSEFTIKEKLE